MLVVLAACGGPGPPSLADYRDHVEEAALAHAEEVARLRRDLEEELPAAIEALGREDAAAFEREAVETTRRAMLAHLAGVGDADGRLRDALGAVEPPTAVATEHRAFLEALSVAVEGLPGLLEAVGGATSFEELDAAIAGSVYADAQPRILAGCRALEAALASKGVPADLHCG